MIATTVGMMLIVAVALMFATAITADVSRPTRVAGMLRYTVKNAEVIPLGALCMLDATGEVLNGADTAACTFAGVAQQSIDNSADGETLLCDKFSQFRAAGSGFTAADLDKDVFLADNNTVAIRADVTNQVRAGRIVQVVSATQVWVDPTLPPEGHGDVTVVADPAAATSTNGVAAAAIPGALTSSNGVAAAAIPGALTSTDGVAAAAAADLAALAAEAEKIGDDTRAIHAAMLLAQAENEKIGDDARAALAKVAAVVDALQAQGLFVAS